jgi:hypothetical protein
VTERIPNWASGSQVQQIKHLAANRIELQQIDPGRRNG